MDNNTRPQKLYVVWIDGTHEEFEIVPPCMEMDDSIKFRINDRTWREVTIPFTNMKLFEIRKD